MAGWIAYTSSIISAVADFISTPPMVYFFGIAMFALVFRLIRAVLGVSQ